MTPLGRVIAGIASVAIFWNTWKVAEMLIDYDAFVGFLLILSLCSTGLRWLTQALTGEK